VKAPICVVVCVNSEEDPYHFVEDGAVATQNMALTAQSLGLGTSWIGVFDRDDGKSSSENRIKRLLRIPKGWRPISILPVGVPKYSRVKDRKSLLLVISNEVF